MAKRSFKSLRGLAVWLLALSQITLMVGCRTDGYSSQGSGNGGYASTAPGSSTGPNLGEIIYGVLHTQLQTSGTQAEVVALEVDHVEFVNAMNQVLPTSTSSNIWPLVQKILPLVDDNTIPNGMGDMEVVLKDLLANQPALAAIADLGTIKSKSALDPKDMIRLVSRLLAYPQLDDLARSTEDLVQNQPDVLKNMQALLARKLQGMTPATFQGNGLGLQSLSSTLLAPHDTTGVGSLGAAAWAVHVDKNGNPAVSLGANGQVFAPFVDDGTGTAGIGADGKPVDAQGKAITITPFGTDGTRDSDGRALAANGDPLFQYFDAKKTLLGIVLFLAGQAVQKDVPADLVKVLNGVIPRIQHPDPNDPYSSFDPANPLGDMTTAQFELVRRAPVHELLEGLSDLVKQNPAGFEDMVTQLIVAMNLAKQSGFSTAGQTQLVNDVLPLLTDACKPQGSSVSAVRALLESFNSANAQLQNLPQGFALMMQYSDYGNKVLTDSTHPSAMQRLLGIMERSNQCNAPFLGNLADLYLDTMAGNNKPILGIKLDIHTMNSLLNIGILRNLLCSGIHADDVNTLQDFANTGTLDAFIPIAKAFSDRGETHLLTQIMLELNADYATAMQPNEPGMIKLLNSGAVNKLLNAVNQMTTITVASNGENLIDVLADTVGVLVDDSHPYTDRLGRTQKTLVNLLMAPMDDFSAAAKAAGVDGNLNNALTNIIDTATATYTDSNGNTKMVYACLVNTLGQTLDFVSQQIPADAAAKSTWCDAQLQSMKDMIGSRDVAALVDMFLQINACPNKAVFTSAIVNLFTPQNDPTQDAFGAIVQLLAGLIQCVPTSGPSSQQQGQDLATIANFVGQEIDPAAGKLTNMMTMAKKLAAADDKLLILNIARNATSTGASGNQDPPIMTLMNVASDVRGADGSSGTLTVQSLTDMLNKAVSFMDDQQNGMPHLFDMIKNRSK